MFGIGIPELIIILVIILLIAGPNKLPQLGAALGETLKSFRKGQEEPRVINPKEEDKKDQP